MAQLSNEDRIKLEKYYQLQEAKKARMYRDLRVFNPLDVAMVPFKEQREFFKSDARIKLARAGNRSGKTFSTCRDISWMICRNHPFNKKWNLGKWTEEAYLNSAPKRFWVFGPNYDFVNSEMWNKYIQGFVPEWFYTDANGKQMVEYTTQKNVDRVTCKNGDIIEFRSYAQDLRSMMGASVDVVLIDEMPPNVMIITELLTRTFDKDGVMIMGFTPLNPVEEIKDFLDTHPNVQTFSWSLIHNPWYKNNPERSQHAVSTWGQCGPAELESRMKGDWYYELKGGFVFANLEMEVVEDFDVPTYWRRCRVADPAAHVTGFCQFAEDPDTGIWYCCDATEFEWKNALATPEHILKEIDRRLPHPGFKYTLSLYDNASGFFGAYAKNVQFRPTMLKNREQAIMALRNEVTSKRLRFFRQKASGLMRQINVYQFRENGMIKKTDDHMLDCAMYFCREIPVYDAKKPNLPKTELEMVAHEWLMKSGVIDKPKVESPWKGGRERTRNATFKTLASRGRR